MRTLVIALSLSLTTSVPALAGTVAIPEPSMIGLFAGGAVAIVIAYRMRNRK
jgi:hypothetical protein